MLPIQTKLPPVEDQIHTLSNLLIGVEVQPKPRVKTLLADLTPDTPWEKRQIAAKKLGHMRSKEAVPGLLATLPADPFWVVRCAIIQALETIGDSRAIPTLRDVAENDEFQVVRGYAMKAIEGLI